MIGAFSSFVRRQFENLPPFWKLAVVRCALYAFIVGWGAFIVGTEGYDSFAQMTQMVKIKLVGGIIMAMVGAWLAFLDTTMTALRQAKEKKLEELEEAPKETTQPKETEK